MPLGSSAGMSVVTCLPCAWAAWYNTWLLNTLTPKGIGFSFSFLFLSACLVFSQLCSGMHASPGPLNLQRSEYACLEVS